MNIRDSAVCFCVFHVQTRLAYVHCRDWGTKYAHAHMLTVNSLIAPSLSPHFSIFLALISLEPISQKPSNANSSKSDQFTPAEQL